jgi:hypothetical protein
MIKHVKIIIKIFDKIISNWVIWLIKKYSKKKNIKILKKINLTKIQLKKRKKKYDWE